MSRELYLCTPDYLHRIGSNHYNLWLSFSVVSGSLSIPFVYKAGWTFSSLRVPDDHGD